MSKIPPDNENFQTIRLLHHSLVSPLKNPLPPINQTAKVCFATIAVNSTGIETKGENAIGTKEAPATESDSISFPCAKDEPKSKISFFIDLISVYSHQIFCTVPLFFITFSSLPEIP